MVIEELVVLLPCHSLEDFPVHHEGEEAEGLLAAWSALWHPGLIAACDRIPLWFRADAPPENPRPRLIVVPAVSDSLLLPGWPTRAKTEGAKLVRKLAKRAEIVAACLESLEPEPQAKARAVPADLVDDFLALGTGYLLVELLTRQMRYMSNLDETRFQTEAQDGARAAVENRHDDARQHLKNAFECLYEARERFYPVDNYLVDLTLIADTTLGPSLRTELFGDVPINLLFTGALLERLAEKEPESLTALRNAIDRRTACVVGGDYDERETPLLPAETVLAELRRGTAAFERLLELRPTAFARRRQGLTPLLPQLLARQGYEGALGFTLDDGTFPTSDQCKTRWEGLSIDAVDCLGRIPLDAAKPDSFLDLPRKVGEAMDRDYVATTVFAHWPAAVSPFYDDLRRMSAYVPILGKFITLADYFDHTERPGQVSKFTPDRYRTTYLRQAIVRNTPNPITWVADGHRRRGHAAALAALTTMSDVVRLRTASTDAQELVAAADQALTPATTADEAAALSSRLQTALAEAAGRAAQAVAGRGSAQEGLLVINTHLGAQREVVDVSALAHAPEIGGAVVAAQESSAGKFAVVDVPGMGFAWLAAGAAPPPAPEKAAGFFRARKAPQSIVHEDSILRNELLEVHVSPKTGGLQGVYGTSLRDRRLSQQVAFRLPQPRPKVGEAWRDPAPAPIYTSMVCDRIETTLAGPAVGEITTHGRLVDADDRPLARFTQRVRVAEGSPVVTLEIELEIDEQPRAEAWASYYACRFAWADETTALGRGVFLMHQPTTAKRPESPYYIELETDLTSTLILPDGLPHHLLTGERMLDTLLIGKGETRRKFRFGIVLEADHPAAAAQAFMEPAITVPGAARPTSGATGWLFFVDAKNVVATHWETLNEGDSVVGFRVRLMETEGLSGRIELRTIRPLKEARHVDGRGDTILTLKPEGDRVGLDIGPYEWLEVEARL